MLKACTWIFYPEICRRLTEQSLEEWQTSLPIVIEFPKMQASLRAQRVAYRPRAHAPEPYAPLVAPRLSNHHQSHPRARGPRRHAHSAGSERAAVRFGRELDVLEVHVFPGERGSSFGEQGAQRGEALFHHPP